MLNFSNILSDLQAAIAVVAARERSLTVLLVAVWGRIARMRTRLERLVAQWRAGTLPKPRKSVATRKTGTRKAGQKYPLAAGWLFARAAAWGCGDDSRELTGLGELVDMRKQPLTTFNRTVLRRAGDQVHIAWASCEALVNIAFAISNNRDLPGRVQHTAGSLGPIQPTLGFLVGRAAVAAGRHQAAGAVPYLRTSQTKQRAASCIHRQHRMHRQSTGASALANRTIALPAQHRCPQQEYCWYPGSPEYPARPPAFRCARRHGQQYPPPLQRRCVGNG